MIGCFAGSAWLMSKYFEQVVDSFKLFVILSLLSVKMLLHRIFKNSFEGFSLNYTEVLTAEAALEKRYYFLLKIMRLCNCGSASKISLKD